MKTGWFRISETKSIPVKLVAGPYPWASAVRLRTESGKEIITTLDLFLESKPINSIEKERAARRIRREKVRAEKAATRSKWANIVLAEIRSRPATLRELHERTGFWWGPIWQRIANWTEFSEVKFDGTKYYL